MAVSYRTSQIDLGNIRPTLQNQGGRRLSKPQTKTLATSSSSLGLHLDSDAAAAAPRHSPASTRSDSTLDLLPQSASALLFNDSRHKSRDRLSGQEQDGDYINTSSDGSAGRSSTVKERISRTGTILSKRASLRASLGTLKSQSRISLPSLGTNVEETDRMINDIKLKAHNDSVIALSHISTNADEKEGKIEKAPIRRRSLFTPGLATRNPSDLLRRPPSPINQEEHDDIEERSRFYNPTLSDSSPLGRLAALDLANKERFTPIQISRSSTPADLDYGHLGSSSALRITNGAVSPTPTGRSSMLGSRKSSSEPHSGYQDSFYTASEGGGLSDNEVMPTLQQIYRRSFDLVDRATTPRPDYSGLPQHGRVCTPPSGPRPSSTRVTSPLRSRIMADSSPSELHVLSDASLEQTHLDRTSKVAQEYINEFSGSPYKQEMEFETHSPLEPTSKANEIEAELFDDAVSRPGSAQFSVHRYSTNYDILQGDIVHTETAISGPVSSISYSTSVTTQSTSSTVSTVFEQRPVADKSDSGYSSSTSLISMMKQKRLSALVTEPASMVLSESRTSSGLNLQEVSVKPASSPYDTVNDTPLVTILDNTEIVPSTTVGVHAFGTEPEIERGRSLQVRTAYRQTSKGMQLPLSKYAPTITCASLHDVSPKASDETVEMAETRSDARSASRGRRKLQKKPRPKSMPPPVARITVTGHRKVSASEVPPVPPEVARRHAARFADFPPLERTVPDLRTIRPGDHTDNTAPVSAPVRFPSPTQAYADYSPKKRVFQGRKLSLSRSRSQYFSQKESHPIPEPSKSDRRRSRQYSPDHIGVANISDFGDVSNALGQSPYDAASSSPNLRSKRGSLIYPHQFTTAVPRAKSMIGMNDEQAAEFAQMRNYYGTQLPPPPVPPPRQAQPAHNVDIKSQKPSVQQRHSFDDRGGIPGKMPRRRSLVIDAPPVPAIPVRAQVDDMERQAKAANRASLLPEAPAWGSVGTSWAQRRKSAGEGLLNRLHTVRQESAPEQATSKPRPQSYKPRPQSYQPQGQGERLVITKKPSVNYNLAVPDDLNSERSQRSAPPALSKSSSTVSLRNIGVKEGIVARLSGRFENGSAGRFDNGFGYGYESGAGLGGSAGMRNPHSVASRKSVEWSKGYGIDLSDVPIFVTPRVN